MSGLPGDPIQPKDSDDPIARFFAAERDAVTDASGDDLRWQTVVGRSRRARRTTMLRYVAAAAAVVVLGGAIVWGVSLRNATVEVAALPQVTRTVYVPASPAPAVTSSAPSAQVAVPSTPSTVAGTSAPPADAVVPADFRVASLTTVASGRLFALGSMSCNGTPCAGVATSADNGATWSLRSTLPGETVPVRSVAPGASRAQQGGVGQAGTVTDVRFADDGIGWVYGADVLRTADGGRTWATYAHTGGGAVVDLATDGTDVVLATASSCDEAACTGDLTILRAPKTAASATSSGDVAGTMSAPGGVHSVRVAWHGSRPVVSAVTDGGTPVTPVVVAVAGLVPLQPPACAGSAAGGSTQLVAPASGTGLYALCPVAVAAGGTTYATYVTGDLGATWAAVSGAVSGVGSGAGSGTSQALRLPSSSLSAAGTDSDHLLVATSAQASGTAGSLSSTADGGAHWSPVVAPPRASGTSSGWRWVGSPGGTVFYAVSDTADGGFWRSNDRGIHWAQVQVAG